MGQINYKRIYEKNRDGWKEATSEGNQKFEQLFAGQYSENNHFIYELLQNAEDVKATFITFVYQADWLTVYHDGLPFTEANVDGICSILDSTKGRDDAQTIGHFGFGFKSVFKYTDRPEVYSDREAFAIERYLLPVEIPLGDFPQDCQYRVGDQVIRPFEEKKHCTRFVLPFKSGLERAGIDPRDILKKLAGLETEILLFLKHVRTLTWIDETTGDCGSYKRIPEEEAPGERSSSFGRICSCQKKQTINGKTQNENSRYLIYEDVFPAKEMASACVKVAFKFQKSAISPVNNALAWVFFPTTDESKLKFLVHGTYQTPISREKIIVDSTFNRTLQRRTENLVVKSLSDLRARDLISQPFLREVLLPSFDAAFFPQLREKITTAFQQGAFLPTSEKEIYCRPDALRLPIPYEMIKTTSSQQITSMGGPDLHFMAFSDASSTGSADYYRWLKNDLGIKLWTISDFADLITEANAEEFDGDTSVLVPLSEIFSEYYSSFSSRNPDYSRDLESSYGAAQEKLKQIVMIPNRAGSLSAAWVGNTENLYFADASMQTLTNERYVLLEGIKEEKKKTVEDFLRDKLEIQTYSHDQYVKMHILPKYEKEPISVSDDEHIQDIRWMRKCGSWIRGYKIIRVKDHSGKCLYVAPQSPTLYFDTDNHGNSIKNYLEDLPGAFYFVDTEFYESYGVTRKELEAFNIKGTHLEKGSDRTGGNFSDIHNKEQRGFPHGAGNTTWRRQGDFLPELSFISLEKVLPYICRNQRFEVSKIIFKLLTQWEQALSGKITWSYYDCCSDNLHCYAIYLLADKEPGYLWLLDKTGRWVHPHDIALCELAPGYEQIAEDSILCECLGFKKVSSNANTAQEHPKVDLTEFINNLSLDELESLRRLLNQKWPVQPAPGKQSSEEFEFPWQAVKNLERLQRHVEDQFACSSPVRYEILQRSIRTTSNDGRAYLRDQYEANGQQCACQLCHSPFPPSKIESVQISERAEWELDQMNLCLCANCATEYRKIRRDAPSMATLESQILAWDETQPQSSPVELPVGKDGRSLWFSPVHLAEVKLLLQLLNDEDTSQSSSED